MIFEPFDKKRHNRTNFSCEVESLEKYFKTQASHEVRKHVAAVFVLANGSDVLGYYTLSSYAIDAGELPAEHVRGLPGYPRLPAILIGRLARDRKHCGKGIGELLLADALRRSRENTATVRAVAVVVEAENENARQFYESFGFTPFPDRLNKLFILMSTIKESMQ